MVHGHQDYGIGAPVSTVYTIEDMAELAARLGSIHTFDRRGNISWFDDFESGYHKWDITLWGTGAAVSQSAVAARVKGLSVKLVGGSDGIEAARMTHRAPFPVLCRMGFEIAWSWCNEVDKLFIELAVYDGTNLHEGQISYDVDGHKWRYLGDDGAQHDFLTNFEHVHTKDLFNITKLVVDPVNDKYVRAIINNNTIDLSSHGLWVAANATLPSVAKYLHIDCQTTKNGTCYVDTAIYTINEE